MLPSKKEVLEWIWSTKMEGMEREEESSKWWRRRRRKEEGGNSMPTLQDWEDFQWFLENTHNEAIMQLTAWIKKEKLDLVEEYSSPLQTNRSNLTVRPSLVHTHSYLNILFKWGWYRIQMRPRYRNNNESGFYIIKVPLQYCAANLQGWVPNCLNH